MSADNEVTELLHWAFIHNKLVEVDVPASILEHGEEPKQRAAIWMEAALSFHQLLMSSKFPPAHFTTSKSQEAQANRAVQELLAWNEILGKQKNKSESQSFSEKEAMIASTMQLPEKEQSERDIHLLKIEKQRLADSVASLTTQVQRLQDEKTSLERSVEQLRSEKTGHEASMQQMRLEKLNERQSLEQSLRDLRQQVEDQRHLSSQQPRSPEAADRAQEKVAATVRPAASNSDNLSLFTSPPANTFSTQNGVSGSSAITPSRSSIVGKAELPPNLKVNPSVASGLAALQNVREQLREIREASTPSPTRTSSYSHLNSSQHRASEIPRSNTFASPPSNFDGNQLNASSPWKQRLAKIHGELKSLKQELGTNS